MRSYSEITLAPMSNRVAASSRLNSTAIEVVSEPDQGSTFRVCVPICETPAATPVAPEPKQELPRGTETILVVEDEEQFRKVVGEFLQGAGYRVTLGESGDKAIRLAGEQPFDGIIRDVRLGHGAAGPEWWGGCTVVGSSRAKRGLLGGSAAAGQSCGLMRSSYGPIARLTNATDTLR